jgi:hypothetical protein
VKGSVAALSADENRSRQLEDALSGLIGLAKMATPKNQALFDKIQVARTDRRVNVAIDAPPELLDLLLK